MGAKTQAISKDSIEKRPAFRCDDCERDFLTLAAIKSHTMAKHPDKYKQMLISETETKEDKKTAFVPPTSRASKRLQQRKSNDKEVTTPNPRKTIFECPKCLKEFGVFFPAHRHIQNRHCEDKDGNPVSSDSPYLIKPVRKEICTLCNKLYHGDVPCGDTSKEGSDNGTYCCLACKQVFQSVASFDKHVEGNHDESIGVVILENMNEFQNWKSNIEVKQRVKYLSLSKTAQKQYYQCNYVSPQNSADVTHLCPSVIIVREFSKGIHIRYHKEHYEHSCPYTQSDNTDTIPDHNETFEDVLKSGVDVYTKLKDLLKSIVERASTLKRTKLKPLFISALEMQAYLNSLKGEADDEPTPLKRHAVQNSVAKTESADNRDEVENVENKVKKIMTDDQIVKALEGTRASNRLKRKSETSPTPEPKKKPKKIEANTGLKESNSQIDLVCTERFESPKPNIALPFSQSPSFNDSYKQFIDSTSPKVEKTEKTEKTTVRRVKKEIVKTKIGQFTPSPKKTAHLKNEPKYEGSKKKKKASVKCTPIKDLKMEEVEYEVREQENDCNILVLKI